VLGQVSAETKESPGGGHRPPKYLFAAIKKSALSRLSLLFSLVLSFTRFLLQHLMG